MTASRTLTPDICVIGAGSAGLTVAAAAASFGHDVVLVERGRMGGDCLNYGCVPSKSLIAAARHAAAMREAGAFGVEGTPEVDFEAVHRHIHGVIASIAPHDSQERFEGLGVTVLRDHARFIDAETVAVGAHRVKPKRTVIATGSSPRIPDLPGVMDCAPLTNESVFDLQALPRRLAILGAGPIGCELGQAFAMLGSRVTLASRERLLPREDPQAAAIVRGALEKAGVALREGAAPTSVAKEGGDVRLAFADGATIDADALLLAVGRIANIADLGLDAAGIETNAQGIVVDSGLRTTNRRVFAIGDVAGGLQFTHVAGYQASLAVRAIVFRMKVRYDPDLMPRATYTTPEVAQVGPTAAEAEARYGDVDIASAPLEANDRARTERISQGFVKLISRRGRLLGATIVAPNAGDLIATYALALAGKVPLKTIASFTPAYPTVAEAGKRAAVNHFAPKFQAPWVQRTLSVLRRLP